MGGGDTDIEGGGGGGGGEGLSAPSFLQQTDPNGVVTSVNGVVTGVEQVAVGVEGRKLGHAPTHNNDAIPPPLGHHPHHQQQLLAMMDPPPPPLTTHSHHLLAPPPSSSTFNHHHHHQQLQQQLASAAPHFQLPNQLPRYLHVLPSHSPPPSSIFPYHHQHHIDFSLPQQPQQSPSPFSPHSHLVVSPPSTLVFSSSPTPTVPTPDQQPTSTSAGSKKRGGSGGLNKLCGVSPALQAIVGEPAMPRTQIVKQLWAYIRKNNLQDPSNKRKIICNDELRLVFETDCTDMFKMNKLLAKHITPLEPNKIPGPEPKKIKTEDSGIHPAEKDQPPVILSDALANFFGIAEKEMLQSEAVQRVMDYIKLNNLEDPLDSKAIQCDSKLQDLFGEESVSVLAIPELLEHHFFKHPEKLLGTD